MYLQYIYIFNIYILYLMQFCSYQYSQIDNIAKYYVSQNKQIKGNSGEEPKIHQVTKTGLKEQNTVQAESQVRLMH